METKKDNWTKSTLFLLPMIEDILGPYYKSYGFQNLYLGDHGYECLWEYSLYALFKPRFTQSYITYETKLEESSACVDVYDVGERRGQVMFVFQVDPSFRKDYDLFKEGKYSHFSPEYKKLFKKGSNIHKVVHKDKELKRYWEKRLNMKLPKDNEVWDMAYPRDEIFRYDKTTHKELKKWREKEEEMKKSVN
tara:strand:+ start:320 stop:895 length:576 start_codon:yes stop_codon:yes gene_type:complete